MSGEVRVVLYSRHGCHLCEVAEATVARVCTDLGVQVRVVDIDTSPDLVAAYGEEVPVTMVDGRRHAIWRVEEASLRAALTTPME